MPYIDLSRTHLTNQNTYMDVRVIVCIYAYTMCTILMYTYFDLSTYPLAALSGKLRGAVNGYDRKAFAESQPMVATERCLGLTIMVASQHVLKQTAAVSQDVSVNN